MHHLVTRLSHRF